jgi:hypothetical protein
VQAEYRYRFNQRGDINLRFFDDNFFRGQETTEERRTYRLGGRHTFSPSSILLASFVYQDANFRVNDDDPFAAPGVITNLNARRPEEAYSGELQHLFRSRYVNVTSGVGYVDIKGRIDITAATVLPAPLDVIRSAPIGTDLRHATPYIYSYLNVLKDVTFILGLSADFRDGESPDVDGKPQYNPKMGAIWSPLPGTTLRIAGFRTLKRTLISNQTLEPTQVAGFNQFFDDFNGTKSWRYGVGLDQKFTNDLFGGVEFAKRNLEVPAVDQFGDRTESNWYESLGRAYLYWTPHPWVALRAEYLYERWRRDDVFTNGISQLRTHRVPLGVGFFHPSGFGAFATTSFFHQEGDFDLLSGEERTGRDQFYTVDAGVRYRLPARYGIITVGVTNLFDKRFRFFDTDLNNPSIQPDRFVFAKVTLAFP